ncbi:hypothetical protein NDU88_008290 [Pleurodeles waltl]|uniref:Uncharacterized protein n=1 Tax=Pleurodeles waltl TaxID=8319 RepID=A0AAV7PPB3_PLEWA|nr:hypothetical protein NDU88_008290 [Pleurodeles waltl]
MQLTRLLGTGDLGAAGGGNCAVDVAGEQVKLSQRGLALSREPDTGRAGQDSNIHADDVNTNFNNNNVDIYMCGTISDDIFNAGNINNDTVD